MPYKEDGKDYTRITEAVGYGDCKRLAFNDKYLDPQRPKRFSLVAVSGTLTHQRIAQFELAKMERPYKQETLSLEEYEKKQFARLYRQHKKIKAQTPEKVTQYQEVLTKVGKTYSNFLVFNSDYEHEPLYVEEKRFSDNLRLAGTIDLIMVHTLCGRLVEEELHEGLGKRRYFREDPNGELHKVATLLDWKTSKSKQKGHQTQMTGYHLMWEIEGWLDGIRGLGIEVNLESWSVLLGEYKPSKRTIAFFGGAPPPYQLYKYYSLS
jgi:hypothetical protein